MPFATDTDEVMAVPTPAAVGIPRLYMYAGAGGGLLVVAISFFVIRRRRENRAARSAAAPQLALPVPVAELERALGRHPMSAEVSATVPSLHETRSVRDRVLEAVRTDVDRTAGLLSSWLASSAKPLTAGKDVTP